MQAPFSLAVPAAISIFSGETKGLTPSWTMTTSQSFETEARPFATDSCLTAPPATTRQLLGKLKRSRISSLKPSSRPGSTTATRSSTHPTLRKRSSVRQMTGRPPISRYCFGTGPPMRLPIPAAAMIAAALIEGPNTPTDRGNARKVRVYAAKEKGPSASGRALGMPISNLQFAKISSISVAISSSETSWAMASSLMMRQRAVSSILRSPKESSFS